MANSTQREHFKKRIIVCCDGTWMNSDGVTQTPTNVTRICRCLKQEGFDETRKKLIPQIIYYQSGVGTGEDFYSKFIGGATGQGLAEHIREAYSFICNNYAPGDEIFIIGFSRGAFTARSISSLIRAVGLLTPNGLVCFYQIFEDWQYQLKEGWISPHPDEPWPGHKNLDSPEYQRKLLELELTRPCIQIKAVAVWDTVGALGIPVIGILPQRTSTDFAFVNTKVEKNIEYAFQALALDEGRRSYSPTIWEREDGQDWPLVLKQCWFPGVHSDVGGSYSDIDLANITLAWMISQLDPLLAFDHSYIVHQNRLSMESHVKKGQVVRDWGLGRIHDSMTWFFRIGGKKVRTPKEYNATDPKNGKNLHRLENTNEHVHSSVRIRMGRKGLGYDDKGSYDSEALKGWTMYGVEASPSTLTLPGAPGQMRNVRWVKDELEMPEDKIGDIERTIMEAWPEIYQDFNSIRPGGHATNVRRSSTFPNDHPTTQQAVAAEDAIGVEHRRPDRIGTI